MDNAKPTYEKLLNRKPIDIIKDVRNKTLAVEYVLLTGLAELVQSVYNKGIVDNQTFHVMDGHFSEVLDFIRKNYPHLDLSPYETIYDCILNQDQDKFDIRKENERSTCLSLDKERLGPQNEPLSYRMVIGGIKPLV
ncbi:MAG: hypothetical protein Q8N99_01480 [Nanoarchaeota archaeon]|nr:hypothetical protein [Nanoarchaeota archaeon]